MRDIKFRAWLDEDEKMLKPTSIWDFGGDYAGASIDGIYLTYQGYPDGKIPLMQYTGLKDKAGVEIYEGDIVYYENVKGHHQKCQILYLDAAFVLWDTHPGYINVFSKYLGHIARSNRQYDTRAYELCEVIGNIYENPELLKENK